MLLEQSTTGIVNSDRFYIFNIHCHYILHVEINFTLKPGFVGKNMQIQTCWYVLYNHFVGRSVTLINLIKWRHVLTFTKAKVINVLGHRSLLGLSCVWMKQMKCMSTTKL